MAIAKHLITPEEFAKLLESRHAELIDGEVIPTIATSFEHGRIVIKLASALENWLTNASAYLGTETGVVVDETSQVRGPDVLYVSAEKMAAQPNPENSWLEVAPDLVAEIVSPNETADDVRLKLRDYQAIKTQLLLLVYAATKEVEVHTLDGTARVYREGDILEFPEVLPGFRLEVVKQFQSIPGV